MALRICMGRGEKRIVRKTVISFGQVNLPQKVERIKELLPETLQNQRQTKTRISLAYVTCLDKRMSSPFLLRFLSLILFIRVDVVALCGTFLGRATSLGATTVAAIVQQLTAIGNAGIGIILIWWHLLAATGIARLTALPTVERQQRFLWRFVVCAPFGCGIAGVATAIVLVHQFLFIFLRVCLVRGVEKILLKKLILISLNS